MRKRIWKELEQRVGIGVFMDILDKASKAMLNDPILNRADLFGGEGTLTDSGEQYLQQTVCDVFNPDHDEEYGTSYYLGLVFTEETFRYFEAEWAAEKAGNTEDAKARVS